MKTRVLTGTYYFLGILLVFLSRIITPYIFDVAIIIVGSIAIFEVAKVLNKSKNINNVWVALSMFYVLSLSFSLGHLFNFDWSHYVMILLGCIGVVLIAAFVVSMCQKSLTSVQLKDSKFESMQGFAFFKSMNTLGLFLYPGVMFSAFYLLNHFNDLKIGALFVDTPMDFYLLLTAFVVVLLTDTFAMLVGVTVKGPKLCPKISPKKTISGSLGGIAGGILGAFLPYWVLSVHTEFATLFNQEFSVWIVLLFGVIGAIVAQFGDIWASYLKRRAKIKDFGNLFPGHGGIMDRMDSLIFNAVFVLFFVLLMF